MPDIVSILIFLAIGAVAGLLAGLIMRGRGFGLAGNIVVGILGAVLGGYLFGLLNIAFLGGLLGEIIVATVGAIIVLAIINWIQKQ
jgi:uncharacterized membrane protein YeaQ/YmgE (transglycosylase-associated protein family)